MDLAAEITERALEVVRSRVEAAAARDREEAAARLLRELELEDAGKKVCLCLEYTLIAPRCCCSWPVGPSIDVHTYLLNSKSLSKCL